MSEEESGIKVTDRRMFTETGELREGFEDLEAAEPQVETEPQKATLEAPIEPAPREAPERSAPGGETPSAPSATSKSPEGYEESPRQPQFLDLVAMLAEPAALFLGDATMPGQEPVEDLDRARMHIDLLALLEDKCRGNLSEQESVVLGDLVYRLRLRYVEKRG